MFRESSLGGDCSFCGEYSLFSEWSLCSEYSLFSEWSLGGDCSLSGEYSLLSECSLSGGCSLTLLTLFGERDPSSLGHQGAGKMLGDVWMYDIALATWSEVATTRTDASNNQGTRD